MSKIPVTLFKQVSGPVIRASVQGAEFDVKGAQQGFVGESTGVNLIVGGEAEVFVRIEGREFIVHTVARVPDKDGTTAATILGIADVEVQVKPAAAPTT